MLGGVGRAARAAFLPVGLAVALVSCTSSVPTARRPTSSAAVTGELASVLKIGFFGPLTGADAQLGAAIEDGEKLAVSEYDASSPKVEVSVDPFDSDTSSAQPGTVAAVLKNGFSKLAGDKVVSVIGPAVSSAAAVVGPMFESAGIPTITVSATAPGLADNGWHYFHRVIADASLEGPADAAFLVRTLGRASVAVVDDGTPYGRTVAAAVRARLGALGATDVFDGEIPQSSTSYSSVVSDVSSSDASAVFVGGYYDTAGHLLKELRAAGYNGVFMSDSGSDDAQFVSDAGDSAAEGAYVSCTCANESGNPAAAAFVAAFKEMFGSDPPMYAAEAYDATNFLLAAVRAGASTPAAVNSYLAGHPYVGMTKLIRFLPDGDVANPGIYVDEVEGAKMVQIGTAG